jgi:abortive infection bacteriophage resistance protein
VKLKSAGSSFSKMKYGTPPLLCADQPSLLISRGLVCPDSARAMEWLQRIGYSTLSTYFILFRQPQTDQFKAAPRLMTL